MKNRDLAIGLALMSPVLFAVLGVVTGELGFKYATAGAVALCVIIVICTDLVNPKLYPLALFSMNLAMMYQVTLLTPYLVGTDIHPEYYYYRESLVNGWNLSISNNYNTAIGLTLVAPFLTRVLHIDGLWVFKAVYPALYSITPVLLYLAFREIIGSKRAFLACFFFVAIPTNLIEVTGITKLQLSGLCISFAIFLLLYRRWTPKLRLALILPAVALIVLTHYSTGYVFLYFVIVGTILALFAKLIKFGTPILPTRVYIALLCATALFVVGYFTLIGSNMSNPLNYVDPARYLVPPTAAQYVTEQEPIIHTALGLDMLSVPADGKIFRVLQLLTEAFIVVGFIVLGYRMWRRRDAVPLEYFALCSAGLLLLLACVVLPTFSRLLNMTRFYYLALYFLAPLVVIGGEFVLHKLGDRTLPALATCVLVPYFLFTSGAVFELEQKPDISTLNIPYSVALSGHRIDITATSTGNDEKVMEWISENYNDDGKVYADLHGTQILMEWLSPDLQGGYMFLDLSKVKDEAWVFLREWNSEHEALVYHAGIGLRKELSYRELGVDKLLDGRPLLYQVGKSKVYGGRQCN